MSARGERGAVVSAGVPVDAATVVGTVSFPFDRLEPTARGRLVRRALVLADVFAFLLAFAATSLLFRVGSVDLVPPLIEAALLAFAVPAMLVLFKLHGLYDRDEERADHSTVDELFGVVQALTIGVWAVAVVGGVSGLASPGLGRLTGFWLLSILFTVGTRALARSTCRRDPRYTQRVVIVGEGDVGQLLARKIQQHREYGLELLGFVDEHPRGRRQDIGSVPKLGTLSQLDEVVTAMHADRVIVAFSTEPDQATMEVVRSLRDREIIVDVVPRLFDLVGPRASMHVIEGLPLVCVPPARLSRSSLAMKRVLDVVCAGVLLCLTTPIFAYAAIRTKLDSPGPVFFRQERLGLNREPFTALKFRTMHVGTDPEQHRMYIRSISGAGATLPESGVYKLEQANAVTPFGRWLRKTSLDELPQLLNVLRGEMSLVGPRPCLEYELENFQPHHFERFLVPQGITGMWQVSARANSTYGEALDMDVAYVRGWSLALDVRLLFRTPLAVLRQRHKTV